MWFGIKIQVYASIIGNYFVCDSVSGRLIVTAIGQECVAVGLI